MFKTIRINLFFIETNKDKEKIKEIFGIIIITTQNLQKKNYITLQKKEYVIG